VNPCRLAQGHEGGAGNIFYADVYPNPATGQATVSFGGNAATKYHLQLLDMTGRKVIEKEGDVVKD